MPQRIREPELNIFVGAPGYGKSTKLAELIQLCTGNVIVYKMELNIDDKAFAKLPVQRDLPKYTGGKVKVSDLDIQYKPFLNAIIKNYRNGMLVIDDAGLYERDILSQEMNRLQMMRRHLGVDIYLVYHGLSFLPIQQFPYVNNVILFHTGDNFGYKASKVPQIGLFSAAQARIKAQVDAGNRYYYEVIKLS